MLPLPAHAADVHGARRQDASSVHDILAGIPAIPDGCQWGIFLRNHDELTLEMVTDEERDYMYQQYAPDPRMRRNVGIAVGCSSRRGRPPSGRAAALLLFTLPGTPILYYGDEIGMGDNINLGDRDGVRTPMQWTPDRNGGFSKADFASVFLPPSMDPVDGFGARNVESSQRNPASFLQWMRRMIQIRREHPILGLGGLTLLPATNSAVLAYIRTPHSARHHRSCPWPTSPRPRSPSSSALQSTPGADRPSSSAGSSSRRSVSSPTCSRCRRSDS